MPRPHFSFSLDQLFKTAAASLTSILNLLATWLILFLVYAIAMMHDCLDRVSISHPLPTGLFKLRSAESALCLLHAFDRALPNLSTARGLMMGL